MKLFILGATGRTGQELGDGTNLYDNYRINSNNYRSI